VVHGCGVAQMPGASGPFSFDQHGRTLSSGCRNPILNRPWSIARQPRRLRAGQTRSDHLHPVKLVGERESANLILGRRNDSCRISDQKG